MRVRPFAVDLLAIHASGCSIGKSHHLVAAAETTVKQIEDAFKDFTNREGIAIVMISQFVSLHGAPCCSARHFTFDIGPADCLTIGVQVANMIRNVINRYQRVSTCCFQLRCADAKLSSVLAGCQPLSPVCSACSLYQQFLKYQARSTPTIQTKIRFCRESRACLVEM